MLWEKSRHNINCTSTVLAISGDYPRVIQCLSWKADLIFLHKKSKNSHSESDM
jgi:hypothetical protein